jgi:hypothetical protein
MKRYKPYFKENKSNEYRELLIKSIYKNWTIYKERYPDEPGIMDPSYMFDVIDGWAPDWQSFIIKSFDKNLFLQPPPYAKPILPYSKIRGRCYYNSLDYIIRHKQDHKNLELCIGFLVDSNIFPRMTKELEGTFYSEALRDVTKHVFLKDGNKILDTTLGQTSKGDFYCYRTIPEEIYKNFHYIPEDSDQDGRAVEKYFDFILLKEKTYFDFKNEFLKYVRNNEKI